tara:strand:- start:840 stop:1184 length:345 start_codon:yes stop_codon:yes gene_type:complete
MENEKIDYEIWLPAYRREDIEVSNHGRVRGTNKKEVLKTYIPKLGTNVFRGMVINYWGEDVIISEIMAETFLNDFYFKEERTIIKFIDGNRYNNHLNNLELISAQENNKRNFKL